MPGKASASDMIRAGGFAFCIVQLFRYIQTLMVAVQTRRWVRSGGVQRLYYVDMNAEVHLRSRVVSLEALGFSFPR